MPGTLDHTPADIVRELLIGLALGTDPDDSGAWPVFSPNEPDLPDEMIAVSDTQGRDGGRTAPDNERAEHQGIQVMVRGKTSPRGWVKANAIAIALDTVWNRNVTMDSSEYTVYGIMRTGNVLPLGKAVPESRRWMFSINAIVSISKTN